MKSFYPIDILLQKQFVGIGSVQSREKMEMHAFRSIGAQNKVSEGEKEMARRYVVGAMTGTSIDGIDVALCEVTGYGLDMQVQVTHTYSDDLPKPIAEKLHKFANEDAAFTARELTELQRDFTLVHVQAVENLLSQRNESTKVDLICAHGQTVYHAPPCSWQLFAPAPLAHALNVPVVCDLRAADVAAGGQGAPLTPLADWILFRDRAGVETRAVCNLGGFCNVTVLGPCDAPADKQVSFADVSACVSGYDVCACSQLLDAVARQRLNAPYDRDGKCATAGVADAAIQADLIEKLKKQARAGRSLGTADSPVRWIASYAHIAANDLAAAAVSAVASVIVESLPESTNSLFLAGGGTRNHALRGAITTLAAGRGISMWMPDGNADGTASGKSDMYASYREAISWAVLGALSQDRVPVTLPRSTGVLDPPAAGLWAFPPY